MKKFISFLMLNLFIFNNAVLANDTVQAKFTQISKDEYKQKTVAKHYKVYNTEIKNNGTKPILLTTDTKVLFTLDDDTVVASDNRRTQYRNVRKRDMGRYYWLGIPGAIIAGGVTGITFFIGAPIGFAIYVGMYAPTDKAVRTNVKISQDLFAQNKLPIRMEPNQIYNVRIFAPKEFNIKKMTISNVSYDLNNKFDIIIKAEDL